MQASRLKAAVALAAAAALAVGASGCAKSERDEDSGGAKTGGTFVFAGAGDPKNFDPIFNDDGETFEAHAATFAVTARRAEATSSTWAAVISGNIGSDSSSAPCRSDSGKSPGPWPSSAKAGCRCTGIG